MSEMLPIYLPRTSKATLFMVWLTNWSASWPNCQFRWTNRKGGKRLSRNDAEMSSIDWITSTKHVIWRSNTFIFSYTVLGWNSISFIKMFTNIFDLEHSSSKLIDGRILFFEKSSIHSYVQSQRLLACERQDCKFRSIYVACQLYTDDMLVSWHSIL